MKIIRNIFLIIIIGIIIIVSIKIHEGYELYEEVLSKCPIEDKVAEIKAKENYTTIEEVPKIYVKAVIAAEDHRYYTHTGIDVIAIVSAIWNDITSLSLAQGGSTITQQLAKNTYFTQEKKLSRKFAEILMAFEFEKKYSKEEILELYLNTCYYGEGCYTVKEASRMYFQKEPIQMTDYESIMLAGIPNAPSVYAPTVNLDLAKERQLQVIRKMVRYNVLTEDEAKKILENAGELVN